MIIVGCVFGSGITKIDLIKNSWIINWKVKNHYWKSQKQYMEFQKLIWDKTYFIEKHRNMSK